MRLHRGDEAQSPEALMRSRYVAYAGGLVDYLIETTDPSGPQWRANDEIWRQELIAYTEATDFTGLEVLDAGVDLKGGFVHFAVTYRQRGEDLTFSERSRFTRVDGRWLYHSGTIQGTPIQGA
jgi:SEC-C motif-containing protein